MKALCDYMRLHAITCDYTGLKVVTKGSEGSVIYHANPSIDGRPWLDELLIRFGDVDENGAEIKFHGAGKAMVFVHIKAETTEVQGVEEQKGEEIEAEEVTSEWESRMVMVHLFCAATGGKRPAHARRKDEGDLVFDMNDELSLCGVHPGLTLPRVRAAYKANGKPFFALVDTQAIDSGLWCQEDYDLEGLYWLIYHKYTITTQ